MTKVYTKTGDKGQTSLLGGTRVEKNHVRIEAYGTLDELNSHIGFLRSYFVDQDVSSQLVVIQQFLFQLGSFLATDIAVMDSQLKVEEVLRQTSALELWIDHMNEKLPFLDKFILPGGSRPVSYAHVCRTVCRRLERRMYDLNQLQTLGETLVYVNRLSDYFFVYARYSAFLLNEEVFCKE